MCVFTPMYHVFLPQWEAASGKKKKHVYHYQGRTFLWISSRSPRKIYTVGKLLLVRCFCRLTLQQCWHKQTHCPISKYYKRIHRLIFQLFKCVFTLCHVFLPQWETSVSKKFTCSLFSRQDFFGYLHGAPSNDCGLMHLCPLLAAAETELTQIIDQFQNTSRKLANFLAYKRTTSSSVLLW